MQDSELKIKRYVHGLRSVCIILIFVGSVEFFLTLIFSHHISELAYTIAMARCFVGSALYLTILYFANEKNYNWLLGALIILYLVTGFVYNFEYGLNTKNESAEILGIRLLDLNFVGVGVGCLLALQFGRFYVTLGAMIFFQSLLALTLYEIFQLDGLYFTLDPTKIASDPLAINKFSFVSYITATAVIIFGTILLAWRNEKNIEDAANQERSTAVLGRYFSPEVREEIKKSSYSVVENNESEKYVAVMFTDIVGFTKLSEGMESKEVLGLLSQYQSKMVKTIFESGGTVDKFIGDAVMATFGTPVSRGNDAQNALQCARQMQIEMREWEKEREHSGKPKIEHRIGIHIGPCFVGNVGSDERVEFTVIGDTVNVASRVCDACKDLNAKVIITDEMKLRLSENISSETIERFEIRGRKEKITLHKIDL
jgi:class 3 adenylate cyclase